MTERDWKRIETELDGLMPGAIEQGPPARKPPQAEIRRADEVALLKHIADALQLDEIA
jgi:hypothetical protein